MSESPKFWLFATICFALSAVLYYLNAGINIFTIANVILFIISVINLIIVSRKTPSKANKNQNKKNKTK